MNRTNILAAIAIMERAKDANSLFMPYWQSSPDSKWRKHPAFDETELHACGNKACFAGHIAVSPEFHASGGYCTEDGEPLLRGMSPVQSIAVWLDIPYALASDFIFGDLIHPDGNSYYSRFYDKIWRNVTPDDVIAKLQSLLNK